MELNLNSCRCIDDFEQNLIPIAFNVTRNMRLDMLQEKLQTKRFGRRVLFHRVVDSTNEWAKKLAEFGVEEGTVTIAEQQTAGKGRLGREWISPKGGLWFSIVLRPCKSVGETTKLVFMASLAVAEVLHQKYRLRTETKWPNDVMVNRRKICGILAETTTSNGKLSYVVLGIGINANIHMDKYFAASDKPLATSIQDELGHEVQLFSLLRTLLEKMERLYDLFIMKGSDSILEKWKAYATFLGREVVVQDQNEQVYGIAHDIDDGGALVLRLKNGTLRRFFAGDLSLRSK
jgi:BirA family biotin operon repressor/biotin-[acetyl-CoA-carboxylase] ligase